MRLESEAEARSLRVSEYNVPRADFILKCDDRRLYKWWEE